MIKKLGMIFLTLILLVGCEPSNKISVNNVPKKVTVIDSQNDKWFKDDWLKDKNDNSSDKQSKPQDNENNSNNSAESKKQSANTAVAQQPQKSEKSTENTPVQKKNNTNENANSTVSQQQSSGNYIKTTNRTRPDLPSKYPVEYWSDVEDRIIVLCNDERSKLGTSALSSIETLREVARYKSDEMLQYNYFQHVSPVTGFQPWDLAATYGWHSSTYGENIWMVQADGLDPNNEQQMQAYRAHITAERIVSDWMNSPDHRENILNKNYTKIGVGLAFSSCGRSYATQEFSN
ncbi:hypothetical protein IAI10_14190 [Clostridium sp. 19966]|uniref:CAP domain-containing protein n=1 Tax=Clostridium sp. 19966 TaxID=2768166 RepID=UPI0028DFBDC1|nr:CAP domain-containing protein [Clostridium sp. 19966]MDT8717814.1 hypothetical protein [Clostridium sp. 19966]